VKQVRHLKTRLHKIVRSSQSGQALVEYVLLLVVSISIIIGLKNAFQSAGEFVRGYVGAYTQCLMEYGELPSLGLDEPDITRHKSDAVGCNHKFKGFTLAEGRPPIGGTGGATQSKSAANSNEKQSQKSSSDNRQSRNAADGGNSSSSGGGSSRSNSPYSSGEIRRNGSGIVADGAKAVSKVKEIEEQVEDGPQRRTPGTETRTVYRVREKYRALTGKMAEDFEKKQNKTAKREPGRLSVVKASDEGYRPGPRTGFINPPERKVAAVEEEKDSGWGLGNLVKWIMIIGIIIALVVFFGGQIMNYSNSD